MKKLIFILFLFSFFEIYPQQYDILGNYYEIKGNVLTKTDFRNELMFQYQSYEYGGITSVDFSNPDEIIVFHKNFSTIAILDENLSVKFFVDFTETTIIPCLVCSSAQNKIWIYDDIERKIILWDITNKSFVEKNSFNPDDEPIFMFESESFPIIIAKKKIYIFDNFGKIKQLVDFDYKSHELNHNKLKITNTDNEEFIFINGKLEKF